MKVAHIIEIIQHKYGNVSTSQTNCQTYQGCSQTYQGCKIQFYYMDDDRTFHYSKWYKTSANFENILLLDVNAHDSSRNELSEYIETALKLEKL